MIKNIENKLKFIELIDEMKNIERAVLLRNKRQETNAEHSFHLALIVIIFAEDFKELDLLKSVQLALVHDLIEIYAGDTIFLVDKKEKLDSKIEREKKALEKIKLNFGDALPNIIELIKEFEDKKSKESRFIYQLDKIQPLIQYVLEGGKGWHKWKFEKNKLLDKYSQIFEKDEFGLKIITDICFKKAEKENMFFELNNNI